ncbi:hypothetical protein SRB5_59500 [Streptomyces sp. RB5]|uniref:Putative zinc-finger domain-containing protein n=1 Tax=Streptomyces smaragdinus TaxID=2585196 RepID=A0A7K0CQL6_9ACTN|nr:zf-HC2 domain-containing protein [Streptomyces smaragdinus]MQY15759.1 hypothetical protein [Streptomyces smaragdinus]
MSSVPHTDVGAYALGLLTGEDATRFEEHLAGCDRCAAELESLLGVTELLADLGPGAPEAEPPPDGLLDRTLAAAAARQRTVRRRRRRLTAVAAVLIVGGPVVTGLVVAGKERTAVVAQNPARDLFERGGLHKAGATDPGSHVTAVVATQAMAWGTHAVLELTGVTGPRSCSLVAVGRDGAEETLSTWSVPAGGYNFGSGQQPLYIDGASGMPPDRIARFVVRTKDGEVLVTVASDT